MAGGGEEMFRRAGCGLCVQVSWWEEGEGGAHNCTN